MTQLLCHLCGDYCLQNDWMANNKTKAWIPAIVHATIYMLPFLLITQSVAAVAVMWSTHLIIDRFRLASYWVRVYGVGQQAPDFLKIWLLIIVDNTMHLTINYFAITRL